MKLSIATTMYERYGTAVQEAWYAACASKQKEIDDLKKRLRLIALEEYEKPPVEPEEVYSPHTEVLK